jgi:hypothetical protein
MPLHDWAETGGWEGVHILWIGELARHLKAKLPPGFRAYLGSGPALAIGAPAVHPDVAVRAGPREPHAAPTGTDQAQDAGGDAAATSGTGAEPDVELAVAALEPVPSLFVERANRLVAAVEVVSPRNKDRPAARATYAARYAGYLIEGVHLMLVDVHPRPSGFSFADEIARELQVPNQLGLPPPLAVSYRVGEPAATGGRLLALWRRPLVPGQSLPTLTLPLDVERSIQVDLEATYMRAAADAYLA